ncbi:MAG: hypothetical protein M3N04_07045, partial [Actinomycetota bacterium]|nr:hypothetical protein [Actinomycetota bacterium]
ATTVFDGWGYAHLYDATTSELIDDFAIQEGIDERYASRFGDLSIHEFATDPSTNLAYAAYYSGGLRVLRFSRAAGLEEVGKFIDEGGSNFWGVEAFTDAAGNRLIAVSDRDYGLYILKYTGPGAVLARPAAPATPATPATPARPATPVAQRPSGAKRAKRLSTFFAFGPLQRLTIRNRRASATIRVPGPGRAVATLRASIGRTSVPIARTTSTAKAGGKLRLTFRLSRAAERSLRRTLTSRRTGRTSGVLRVTFTRTGARKRTRNKALSITIAAVPLPRP